MAVWRRVQDAQWVSRRSPKVWRIVIPIFLLEGAWIMLEGREGEQLSLELDELRRALRWERTQKERLLTELDILRRENQRLRETVDDLEVRLAEIAQQRTLF